MFGDSIVKSILSGQGAKTLTIFMIVLVSVLILMSITKLPLVGLFHSFLMFLKSIFARAINKQEEVYHRDLEVGKLNEKRTKVKLYRFLNDLIIDLGMSHTGITPYELLWMTILLTMIVTSIVCKLLFGTFAMAIFLGPIMILGVFCVMYTRANVAHDTRIESVLEAENIICNNIKIGVVAAVRDSLNVLPAAVRQDFQDFVNDVETKNTHVRTALMELNGKLGGIADNFIKKCIVFEMEEQHGIAGVFTDVVEVNNIVMQMRIEMKRKFEEVVNNFVIGALMIFFFLGAVLVIYPDVREFYFGNFVGNIIIAIDMLLLVIEYVYITMLRAQEL